MEPNLGNPLREELTGKDPIVNWILPGFIPQNALIAVAGAPGAGKSFLLYTIGLALAAGIPVLGMTPNRPYKVLYFDQENSKPDRVQYERWAWNGLGKPDLDTLSANFWVSSFELGGADWAVKAEARVREHAPDLIVVDTTTPACNIQDENDNAEAAKAIGNIRKLQTVHQSAAIVLKHAKVKIEGDGYTLRGAKTWEGAVDSIVYVTKKKGRPRKDGLNNVFMNPSKTRAFGLREPVAVVPSWLDDRSGITLTRREIAPDDDSE